MSLTDLTQLIDYHYWARDRLLDAVGGLSTEQFTEEMVSSFPSVRDTLVHAYSSEWAWYSRWVGRSPGAPLSPSGFPDLPTLRRAWVEHESAVRAFVGDLGEAGSGRVIDYRLFNGQAGSSTLAEMVRHVVNHASYHRGQVVTMLRQLGATPPRSLDLITYYRELQRTSSA